MDIVLFALLVVVAAFIISSGLSLWTIRIYQRLYEQADKRNLELIDRFVHNRIPERFQQKAATPGMPDAVPDLDSMLTGDDPLSLAEREAEELVLNKGNEPE